MWCVIVINNILDLGPRASLYGLQCTGSLNSKTYTTQRESTGKRAAAEAHYPFSLSALGRSRRCVAVQSIIGKITYKLHWHQKTLPLTTNTNRPFPVVAQPKKDAFFTKRFQWTMHFMFGARTNCFHTTQAKTIPERIRSHRANFDCEPCSARQKAYDQKMNPTLRVTTQLHICSLCAFFPTCQRQNLSIPCRLLPLRPQF